MINGLEGIPGSGKSYEATVYHVLAALQTGRLVITNLPLNVEVFAAIDPAYRSLIQIRRRPAPVLGVWDANAIDDNGNGQAFKLFSESTSLSEVVHVADHQSAKASAPVFGSVWDYHTTWKHPETGQGPLYVIDECHVSFPKIGTDPQVVEWFKLHRHFNADVLLMTQNFRDINQPIAGLVAMLIKVRSADILGKKGRYIRKVHAGYRGAVITTEEREYKPQYFPLYKSHTNGNSVSESSATDVKSEYRAFMLFSRAFYVVAALACIWAFWPSEKPQKATKIAPPVDVSSLPQDDLMRAAFPPPQAVQKPAPAPLQNSQEEPSQVDDPEPYATKGLHLTGRITMGDKTVYTFSVSSSGQRISTLDSRELKAAGYTWEPLTDCAGILRFKAKAIAITCDAPAMASGSNDKPLVLEVPEGGGAPTGSSRTTPQTSASFQPPPAQQPYSTPADVVAAYRPR